MAFVKKTWKDRIAEFPTRRRLTKEDNTSELVTVAREEGTLSQEGDAFSAENMNDLENRIDAEFTEVNGKLQLNEVEYSSFISASSPNSIDKAKIYKSNNRLCGYIQINTDNTIRSDGRIILGQTLFVKTGYRPKQVCLLAGQVYSNTYSKYCPAIYQLNTDGGLVVTTPLNDGSVTGFYINLDYDLA